MRRLAHNEDWGFAPVLSSKGLYPANFPAALRYLPADEAFSRCPYFLEISITPERLTVRARALFPAVQSNESACGAVDFEDCDFAIQDFIGVAVQYGVMPAPLLNAQPGAPRGRGTGPLARPEAVTLYLMHEERASDVLLYFADHEDEILAQWQFWTSRLSLPKLVVSADGYVHEGHDSEGLLANRPPRRRGKAYAMNGRRPVFNRVRDVGSGQRATPIAEREIFARD